MLRCSISSPLLYSRHLEAKLTPEQQAEYDKATKYTKRHFIIALPDGWLAWNSKSFRTTILLSA